MLLNEAQMLTRRQFLKTAGVAGVGLVAVACQRGPEEVEGAERTVMRFAFAPDPAWDYLNDTGEIVAWEEANNTRVVTTTTWDEFTFFAGGHGDLVSIATYEVPVIEQETGITTVSFGKYNHLRVPMLTRADKPYETLADVPKGSKICVSSAVSNTIFWSVYAAEIHGLNYRVGEGDFELVINDHFLNPELLMRGECEAAAIIPEAAAPWLRRGDLKVMYGGKMPFQLYQEISPDPGHLGVMGNLFTATAEWFDANPEAAGAFLGLWQRGVDLWQQNQEEIIRTYPQHFAVEEEADVDWMIDFMAQPGNDWFVDSVYLDETWVESELNFLDLMKEHGWLDPNAPTPRFEVVSP